MDDFLDQNGNISLFALATRPKYPKGDPRHLTPDAVSQMARHRIEQMKREQAVNIAALSAVEGADK